MKEIVLTPSEKRLLREKYELAQSTINYALKGARRSSLVIFIREKATEIVNNRNT